jgi:YVTN family beta-propeller protein
MKNSLRLLAILAFLGATAGCGHVAPVASPLPHTAAVVHPAGGPGPAYLFASNRFVGMVFRIDLANQAVDGVLVGSKPNNLAGSPDGTLIAVANEDSGSVSLIEAVKLRVYEIPTGAYPLDVRFSPDGQWLAVANYNDESVTLIDPASRETWRIWVGGGPASVDFDAASQFVVVACFDANAVVLLSVAGKKLVATWSLADLLQSGVGGPQTVAFGPRDSAFGNTFFVGLNTGATGTSANSVAVVPFPRLFYDDPTVTPTDAQLVQAGPNPSGFVWNHDLTKLLTVNHRDFGGGSTEGDSVSELVYQSDGSLSPPPAPPPAAPFQLAVAQTQWLVNLTPVWRQVSGFVVGVNPTSAVLAPDSDLVAVASNDSAEVSFLDLATSGMTTVPVAASPYALAYSPSGEYVFVVHETPLMPVSLVNVADGTSHILYKSLSMKRWLP